MESININPDGKNLNDIFYMSKEESSKIQDKLNKIFSEDYTISEIITKCCEIAKNPTELSFIMVGVGAYIQHMRPVTDEDIEEEMKKELLEKNITVIPKERGWSKNF